MLENHLSRAEKRKFENLLARADRLLEEVGVKHNIKKSPQMI